MKQINFGVQGLLNEISVHWALENCQGVLKLLKIYEDSVFIMLVLEYQPKGTLMETLELQKKFSEAQVRGIMEQILLVLDFFQ